MKQHKNILLVMLAAVALFQLTACKKELEDVVPQDAISKDLILTDPNAAQTLYNGAYSLFRSSNSTFYQLGEMRSEIWTDGLFTESADAGLQNLNRHNISALNVPFGNWGGFYNMIYNLNSIIKLFPQTTLPAVTRNTELAEIYGLRAYVYYTMLKTWGAVPLTTQPIETINNAFDTYKKRTETDSIMIQVKADIEKSLQLFGSSNVIPSGKRVYWNRIATLTLKGDVYLWSGTQMGGGNADFTIAKTVLQEVQSLQGATLNLAANYADIFDPTKKPNNPEIIFAINYELQQATTGVFGSF